MVWWNIYFGFHCNIVKNKLISYFFFPHPTLSNSMCLYDAYVAIVQKMETWIENQGHVKRGILTMHDCVGVGRLFSQCATVSWLLVKIADRLHATLHFHGGPADQKKTDPTLPSTSPLLRSLYWKATTHGVSTR